MNTSFHQAYAVLLCAALLVGACAKNDKAPISDDPLAVLKQLTVVGDLRDADQAATILGSSYDKAQFAATGRMILHRPPYWLDAVSYSFGPLSVSTNVDISMNRYCARLTDIVSVFGPNYHDIRHSYFDGPVGFAISYQIGDRRSLSFRGAMTGCLAAMDMTGIISRR